jgi:hypothetical protein
MVILVISIISGNLNIDIDIRGIRYRNRHVINRKLYRSLSINTAALDLVPINPDKMKFSVYGSIIPSFTKILYFVFLRVNKGLINRHKAKGISVAFNFRR